MTSSIRALITTRLGATVLFALFPLAASLLAAQDQEIRASLSPVKDFLILHEPVIVRLMVENPVDEPVKMDFGIWFYGSLSATLTKPDRQVVKGRHPMGFGPPGKVTLAPHSTYEIPLLANRWSDFDDAGTYVLDIALPEPIRNERGAVLTHSIKGRAIFSVGPSDPEQLRRICASLAEKAIKYLPPTEADVSAAEGATSEAENEASAVEAEVSTAEDEASAAERAVRAPEDMMLPEDALSYINDPVAVPFLASLLRPEVRWNDRAIQGLARIADRASIEVLISQLGSQSEDLRERSREALSRVERTTKDVAIQQRIQDALR